jgi:hypothetical protein
MPEEILETVEMVSHFRNGSVIPCRFRWRNRVYSITRVNLCWESRPGVYKRYHFMVRTRSGDVYEMHFDTENLRWILDCGYTGGA